MAFNLCDSCDEECKQPVPIDGCNRYIQPGEDTRFATSYTSTPKKRKKRAARVTVPSKP